MMLGKKILMSHWELTKLAVAELFGTPSMTRASIDYVISNCTFGCDISPTI